jgi:hypothetical protein
VPLVSTVYINIFILSVAAICLTLFVFFLDFADFSIDHDKYGIVQSDRCHPPIISDYTMPFRNPKHNFNISFKDILQGFNIALERIICL